MCNVEQSKHKQYEGTSPRPLPEDREIMASLNGTDNAVFSGTQEEFEE